MNINIKNKDVELKYTFNSFKHMVELDMNALAELENKPFRMVPMLEILLMGAVNNNPKINFTLMDIQTFIEKYAENESISALLEELMAKLQESSFFKSLQRGK